MPSTSLLDVFNGALILLGERLLASEDEDTEPANLCQARIKTVVQSVLRDFPWACAKKRELLAQVVEPGVVTPYQQAGIGLLYQIPTDMLRALSVNARPDCNTGGDRFKIEGNTLRTFATQANLLYIRDLQTPGDWDSMLREAIETKLAAAIAFRITGNNRAAQQDAAAAYQVLLQQARTVASQEGTPAYTDYSSWVDDHLGGYPSADPFRTNWPRT